MNFRPRNEQKTDELPEAVVKVKRAIAEFDSSMKQGPKEQAGEQSQAAESLSGRTPGNGVQRGANPARRRAALGRGLSALMAASTVEVSVEPQSQVQGVSPAGPQSAAGGAPYRAYIPDPGHRPKFAADIQDEAEEGSLAHLLLDRIIPNQNQPRQHFAEEELAALAESVRTTGLLQPIVVRRLAAEAGSVARYEIVAGERRFRAAQRAGLKKIPVLVRHLNDREALELGIVENLQRSNLNPVEEAKAFERLLREFQATQEEVARVVGRDRASVANSLRLLRLPAALQELLIQGVITAGHGRALLALQSEEEQLRLAERISSEALSVRAAEQAAASARELRSRDVSASSDTASGSPSGSSNPSGSSSASGALRTSLEERFRRALGTKVALSWSSSGKGELRISFFSKAELESLLEKLNA